MNRRKVHTRGGGRRPHRLPIRATMVTDWHTMPNTVHELCLDLARTTDSRVERWAFLAVASLEEGSARRFDRAVKRESDRVAAENRRWHESFVRSCAEFGALCEHFFRRPAPVFVPPFPGTTPTN